MNYRRDFDVIVIGGGHAGAEAARVCARGGARVAMVTMLREAIGRMSCNPAIGGLAKGNLVKEIDALGGLMGEATDRAGIQFKVLNRSKGPAVQGPRAQCDRDLYAAAVQQILASEPNLSIVEGAVSAVRLAGGPFRFSVLLGTEGVLYANAVIVTTGTFLRALMHSGEVKSVGGRFGEPAAETLSDSLAAFGLQLGRLKTGTPPRVAKHSVDFTKMAEAAGDAFPRPFSILTDKLELPQVLCHVTYTGAVAHELIRANLHRAPMYSGQIQATGPRYCPSIEDKVVRFADKERHQVFVEPEGLEHPWLYLNGISTSLPPDIQDGVVRSLAGFENAVIARYGYAVEYDFVNPRQLQPTLQVRGVDGLFLAGQINGTSGYEEAGAQGLLAGINALQSIRGGDPVVLRRDEAYTAVMLDDLVTVGTAEPYRMFTSRAEHRLLLGCDSVYERLTPIAQRLGILDDERKRRVDARLERLSTGRNLAQSTALNPDQETLSWLPSEISGPTTVARLMQRPEFEIDAFRLSAACALPVLAKAYEVMSEEEREAIVSHFRYAGYVDRQKKEAERILEDDNVAAISILRMHLRRGRPQSAECRVQNAG